MTASMCPDLTVTEIVRRSGAPAPADDLIRWWFGERIVVTEAGCWEWHRPRGSWGYGYVMFEGRVQAAHRVAWQLAYGPIPAGLLVCHRCDNPPCCNPADLFLGTPADNAHDRMAKGRFRRRPFGRRQHNVKLARWQKQPAGLERLATVVKTLVRS